VVFHEESALAAFRRAGLEVTGNLVLIPEIAVSRALATAPEAFILRGRPPQPDLQLGGKGLVLASASGAPYVLDERGAFRPGTIADFETAIKLGQMLPNLDMNGQCLEPLDLPLEERYRRTLLAALTLSDKALEYPMARPEHARQSFDTLEILLGSGWDQEVRLLAVVNSMSPLQFSAEMAYAAVRVAQRGQAVCVTPSAMGGMTAPSTLAGILTVQNAEVLAGLVLVQLVREGCPFVYGGTSSLASMATGDFLVGVPQYLTLVGPPPPWPATMACPAGPGEH
jgi:trimethylamine--corrinoid protein Co-methyltransferase